MYSSPEKTTKSSNLIDFNILPATLDGKLLPSRVKIGKHPLIASTAVV